MIGYLPSDRSIATALALALCSHNLTRIILRGIGKIEPPPEYQDCTILRLLQHRKLTHLTLENSDITELISLQSPLETLKDSQIRILSIGPYEGEAKIADYEKAAGILIDGLADTLEELTLGVCPKLNSTLRPLHRLRILRLSVDFPIASILRTLKAFIIAGESNIQELHICCSEEKRQELGDVLSKFEPHTYPSLRKVTYREGQESPKELCKEADESGPERLWERFMAILQSSQS